MELKNKKKPLVLIHGFLSGPEYWNKQVDFFNDKFNVILINLPGYSGLHGQNGCDSINDFALSSIHALDAMGIDDFYLLGHSMGGMIAQEIVHIVPNRVKKLILYGTGPQGSLPGRFEPLETSISKASEKKLY